MSIDDIIPDCALEHYKTLSSLPRKEEELPDDIRKLLEKNKLIEFNTAQGYYLTTAGNRAVRKIEHKVWVANLRKSLPELGWCSLYTTLGFASGFMIFDALLRSEPPSMLESIANSNIMKAELASPAITYAGVLAATTIESKKYNRKSKRALGLNSAIYVAGFAAGLMGRALYLVATSK